MQCHTFYKLENSYREKPNLAFTSTVFQSLFYEDLSGAACRWDQSSFAKFPNNEVLRNFIICGFEIK
jgi:hypothetical protein